MRSALGPELRRRVHVVVGDEDPPLPDVRGRMFHPRAQPGPHEMVRALARIPLRLFGRPHHGTAEDFTARCNLYDDALRGVDPSAPHRRLSTGTAPENRQTDSH